MANTITSFFQTLVAEVSKASSLLAPTWALAGSCFWDYSPVAATIGQTLNVPIPTDPTPQWTVPDAGAGDISLTDIAFTTRSITFDQHPLFSYVVRDFEQFNAPSLVRSVFADAALKVVQNNINAKIISQITTANLNVNLWNGTNHNWVAGTTFYPCTGASGKCLSVAEFLSPSATAGGLFSRLSDLNVPVQSNPANMSLVVGTAPYARLMDSTSPAGTTNDPNWSTAWQAGMGVTEDVRRSGVMPTVFGMNVKLDQQMPVTGTAPARTFTGIYMHRYSIAVASRPLPRPDPKVCEFEYIDMKANDDYSNIPEGGMRLPIRVQVAYNPYPKLGYIVIIDAGYGLKTMRPEMAIPFTVAE